MWCVVCGVLCEVCSIWCCVLYAVFGVKCAAFVVVGLVSGVCCDVFFLSVQVVFDV